MMWQHKNKTLRKCACGNDTYEVDGICVACKVMAEVEAKCQRLDADAAGAFLKEEKG
jgi:hypothetical protein